MREPSIHACESICDGRSAAAAVSLTRESSTSNSKTLCSSFDLWPTVFIAVELRKILENF